MYNNTQDDCRMMRDMLMRRFKDASELDFPNLIIIDGGMNQLSAAKNVLIELEVKDVDIIAIVKGDGRKEMNDKFIMQSGSILNADLKNESLKYIQRLRNEAHKFAINKYRKLHRNTLKSSLSNISGVGNKKAKLLLNIFGSYEKLSNVSADEIFQVPGIGEKLGKKIYNYLHDVKDL